MSSILVHGTGNIDTNNPNTKRAIQTALDHKPTSWTWSEGNKIPRVPKDEDYYRLQSFGFADPKDANDCIQYISKDVNLRHFSMTQVSDDANPTRLAHDRVFSVSAYEWNGIVVAPVGIHPNWIVGFKNPNAEIVKEYVKSVEALEDLLVFITAMGWKPIVSGDFNLPKNDRRVHQTTYDVFESFDMKVKTEHIDGMAWDKSLKLDNWIRIPQSQTQSDHKYWIVAKFSLKA